MITQAETGFSNDEYAGIQDNVEYPAYQLIAHRGRPDFSMTGVSGDVGVWDGADYIFTVKPVFVSGSADFFSSLEVYRYSVLAQTNTLVYTHSIGKAHNIRRTKPAISIQSDGKVNVWYARHDGTWTTHLYKLVLNVGGATLFSGPTSVYNETENIDSSWDRYQIMPFQTALNKVDDTVPGYPTIVASSSVGANVISRAFDDSVSTYWQSNLAAVTITFTEIYGGTEICPGITRYSITINATANASPRSWTLERWDAGTSTWIVCDTRSLITWTPSQTKTFDCTLPAYGIVRFNQTLDNGARDQILNMSLYSDVREKANIYSSDPVPLIGHIAAVGDAVYFATQNTNDGTVRLMSNSYSSSSVGNIALQDFPSSLSACETPDGKHFLCASIMNTSALQTVADGADVDKYIQMEYNLYGFYANSGGASGTFYDIEGIPVDIDTIPADPVEGIMNNIGLTYGNGLMFLTVAQKRRGNKTDGIYLYTSKDGQTWSAPELIDSDPTAAMPVFAVDELIITPRGAGYSTHAFGLSASVNQEDITDYIDSGYTATIDPMLQVGFILDNSDGHFTNHPFISRDNLVIFDHFIGYRPVVDGVLDVGEPPLLVPLGRTVMETFGRDKTLPEYMIRVSARDYLSYLTDYVKLTEPKYFTSQIIGLDDYNDKTDTNYGGLSHTALQSGGDWTTSDGVLSYTQPAVREDSVVFNTMSIAPISHGIVEVDVTFPDATTRAGIVFHALDKDNYASIDIYGDTVMMRVVRAGVPTQSGVFTGVAMSGHLRIQFNFLSVLVSRRQNTIQSPPLPVTLVASVGVGGAPAIIQPTPAFPIAAMNLYRRPMEFAPLTSGYVGLFAN